MARSRRQRTLDRALEEEGWDRAVLKPRIAATAYGTFLIARGAALSDEDLAPARASGALLQEVVPGDRRARRNVDRLLRAARSATPSRSARRTANFACNRISAAASSPRSPSTALLVIRRSRHDARARHVPLRAGRRGRIEPRPAADGARADRARALFPDRPGGRRPHGPVSSSIDCRSDSRCGSSPSPCRRPVERASNERAMAMLQRLDRHRRSARRRRDRRRPRDRSTAWNYRRPRHDARLRRSARRVPLDSAIAIAPGAGRSAARTISAAIQEQHTRTSSARGDFDTFRKRAAILHTDAAHPRSAAGGRRSADRTVSRSRAGRARTPSAASTSRASTAVSKASSSRTRIGISRWICSTRCRQSPRDPIVAQWYRAIGAYFARATRLRRCASGTSSVPGASCPTIPHVLFGEACLKETLGAPRVQNYVGSRRCPTAW